jgi:predicted GIY-YIG superfamily endonuclease
LKDNKFRSENPDINSSLPCYYVGITGLSPKERFKNHKEGHKASKIVRIYGLHLCPDIYKKYNPMSYDSAAKMEEKLAGKLRKKGHGVW